MMDYRIPLDIKPKSFPKISQTTLTASDTGNYLYFAIQDGGIGVDMSKYFSTVTFEREDGKAFLVKADIEDTFVKCKVPGVVTQIEGTLLCTVQLYDEDKNRVTSLMLQMNTVRELLPTDDIVEDSSYLILVELIEDVEKLKREIEGLKDDYFEINKDFSDNMDELAKIIKKGNDFLEQAHYMVMAEGERNFNETQRKMDENVRNVQEKDRMYREKIRQEEETTRGLDEQERNENEVIRQATHEATTAMAIAFSQAEAKREENEEGRKVLSLELQEMLDNKEQFKGEKGDTGPKGEPGEKGEPGAVGANEGILSGKASITGKNIDQSVILSSTGFNSIAGNSTSISSENARTLSGFNTSISSKNAVLGGEQNTAINSTGADVNGKQNTVIGGGGMTKITGSGNTIIGGTGKNVINSANNTVVVGSHNFTTSKSNKIVCGMNGQPDSGDHTGVKWEIDNATGVIIANDVKNYKGESAFADLDDEDILGIGPIHADKPPSEYPMGISELYARGENGVNKYGYPFEFSGVITYRLYADSAWQFVFSFVNGGKVANNAKVRTHNFEAEDKWGEWETLTTKEEVQSLIDVVDAKVDEVFQSGIEINKGVVEALNSFDKTASTDDGIKTNVDKFKTIKVFDPFTFEAKIQGSTFPMQPAFYKNAKIKVNIPNLVPANVKKGVDVGGVIGTNETEITSDKIEAKIVTSPGTHSVNGKILGLVVNAIAVLGRNVMHDSKVAFDGVNTNLSARHSISTTDGSVVISTDGRVISSSSVSVSMSNDNAVSDVRSNVVIIYAVK